MEKLKMCRKKANYTQEAIAKMLEISRTTYTQYETGASQPDVKTLSKLADIFNVSIDYLVGRKELVVDDRDLSMLAKINSLNKDSLDVINLILSRDTFKLGNATNNISNSNLKIPDQKSIQTLGKASAGLPIEMVPYDYGTIATNDPHIFENDFAIIVQGDSMIEEGIHDGNVVVVHKQDTLENGEIGLISIDNEFSTIKKFYKFGKRVELVPANPSHTKQTYFTDKTQITILGKIVKIIN